jgi:hypothetical protein
MEADKGEGSEDEQRSSELVAVAYLATEFYAIVKITVAVSGSRFEEKLE